MNGTKEYIGDGVYAQVVNDDLILTTEDGYSATNTIVLEREVRAALIRFVKRMNAQPPTTVLQGRLAKVEARECTCGMNRCARCDEGAWLRSVLGLPQEQDELMVTSDRAEQARDNCDRWRDV